MSGSGEGSGCRGATARAVPAVAAVLAACSLTACGPAPAEVRAGGELLERWVALPAGTTPLETIGLYRVGYQQYRRDAVYMPISWSGPFTEDSGIAFQRGTLAGRAALLLHCPWRGETGVSFVEYRLSLPRRRPIRLLFAVAMRPDVVEKSDGVTFCAKVTCGGETNELVRQHHAAAEPKDFRLDLSEYAGKNVVLRLETWPGPQKNAGFDFSYFVEPRIVVGKAAGRREKLVSEMTATRASRVHRRADLSRLANRPGRGIVPSCEVEFRNGVRRVAGAAELAYEGPDCRIVYRYEPKSGTLSDVWASVDGRAAFPPCAQGGVTLAGKGGRGRRAAKLRAFDVTDGAARATWQYTRGDASAEVSWTFRIDGKALVIEAESKDGCIAAFSLGRPVSDFRTSIPVPYLYPRAVDFLPDQKLFCLAWLDWKKSRASRAPAGEAVYTPTLDGRRNALREVGYVAVSPVLGEVLPSIPHPPSPYVERLAPKVVLDVWGGRFADIVERLEEYKSHGLDELAVIVHNWQRYGYDVKLPDHLPPNPALGGHAGMKRLADTARRLGYLFSLHENYIDFYPDAPSWQPKDVVRNARGEMQKAWYQPGTKVQSFAVKADRMLHYARQNSPKIHERYGTTAAYLDVHTCTPPWHYVDYDPAAPMAAMHACKVKHHAELFAFERETHGGPLFGEGHQHFYWAGLVCGVEAQVRGGEDAGVLVDFDLLKLHPQMVNHGMGYYTRWLRKGRASVRGVDWPTPAQMDKYRAQELAYGHAGFLGSGVLDVMPLAVREYNLVQPLQARYAAAKAAEISYEVAGEFVSSGAAAAAGALDRLRVRYDSDLMLHVNLRADDWKVGGHVLPQYGFLAEGAGVRAWTARVGGVIADYARTKDRLYCDARTNVYRPWAAGVRDVEPRLKTLQPLDGGRLRIAYEWRVGQSLPDGLHCFVHFNGPRKRGGENILFQNDHAPPKPTGQWKAGETIADGPHVVTVPQDVQADTINVLIGLYSRERGRVTLKGLQYGQQRVLIGRLRIRRKDGRIEAIEPEDLAPVRAEFGRARRPFLERMNVSGRRVEFGPAATDGAFQLRVHADRLELLAYPREKAFGVELNLTRLTGRGRIAKASVTAVDAAGKPLGEVPAKLTGAVLTFAVGRPGAARYVIRFE